MLKLKYDVKCGWKQLYIVEKDLEMDISFLVGEWDDGSVPFANTEKEFYEKYKNRHDEKLIFDLGIGDLIGEENINYYAHKYFEDICKKQKCFPPLKCSNLDILWNEKEDGEHYSFCGEYSVDHPYSTEEEETLNSDLKTLRASEVMSILDISRNTLSTYVKKGLIKVDPNYTGKQYRYLTESVIALLDGKKKHY